MVVAGVEVGLKKVGIAFAEFGAVAFGEAVSEADDDGAVIVDGCGLGLGLRCDGGGFGSGGGFAGVKIFGIFCGVVDFASGK